MNASSSYDCPSRAFARYSIMHKVMAMMSALRRAEAQAPRRASAGATANPPPPPPAAPARPPIAKTANTAMEMQKYTELA